MNSFSPSNAVDDFLKTNVKMKEYWIISWSNHPQRMVSKVITKRNLGKIFCRTIDKNRVYLIRDVG